MAASSPRVTDTTPKITNATWLWIGRFIWGVLFCLSVYTLVVVTPTIYEQTRNIGPNVAAGLAQIGLSADLFAAYAVGVQILITLTYFAVGIFMFWRRSDDRMGLLTTIFLITYGACA